MVSGMVGVKAINSRIKNKGGGGRKKKTGS